MKTLYVPAKYDRRRPEQGFRLVQATFCDPLAHMGRDLISFDSLTVQQELGQAGMNSRLKYDVNFIGGVHGRRQELMDRLRRAAIRSYTRMGVRATPTASA